MTTPYQIDDTIQMARFTHIFGCEGAAVDVSTDQYPIAGMDHFRRNASRMGCTRCGQLIEAHHAVLGLIAANSHDKTLGVAIRHQKIAIGHAAGQG